MICIRHSVTLLVLALTGAALTSRASAASITITNPGFESPVTSTASQANLNPVPGWTPNTGDGGVWNINNDPMGFWSVPAPEGNQILYVGGALGAETFSQTLSDTLLANMVYNLTGEVGNDISLTPTYTVALYAGGNLLASGSGIAPQGSFTPFNVIFNSTGSAFVGQALEIRLSTSGSQSGFDAIQLETTFAPEPASIGLVLFSSMGLLSRWRR